MFLNPTAAFLPKYLRFVDDFALLSDDRGFLEEALAAIREHLVGLRIPADV